MRTRIALAIISFALLRNAQAEPVQNMDPEVKAVNAVFDQYVRGWQTGDINLLGTIYAHDPKLTAYWPDPTRPFRLEGWSTVQQNLKEVFDLIHRMNLEFDQREIDVYGGVAVLTTHWTWHQPSGVFFEHGRGTFIFKKEDGKWRIVHEHSSVTPFIPGQDSEFVIQETSR